MRSELQSILASAVQCVLIVSLACNIRIVVRRSPFVAGLESIRYLSCGLFVVLSRPEVWSSWIDCMPKQLRHLFLLGPSVCSGCCICSAVVAAYCKIGSSITKTRRFVHSSMTQEHWFTPENQIWLAGRWSEPCRENERTITERYIYIYIEREREREREGEL